MKMCPICRGPLETTTVGSKDWHCPVSHKMDNITQELESWEVLGIHIIEAEHGAYRDWVPRHVYEQHKSALQRLRYVLVKHLTHGYKIPGGKSMAKFTMKVEKEVTAKRVRVVAKVRDSGSYSLIADDETRLKDHDGYVPDFFPRDFDGGSHYGDYLYLDIDIETGQILNWKAPSAEALKDFVDGPEE